MEGEEEDTDDERSFLKKPIWKTLLYAGQEFSCIHQPSLFERDVIERSGRDISSLLVKLAEIKKNGLSEDDSFSASADDKHAIAVMERRNGDLRKIGVFSLRSESAEIRVDVPDGEYTDLIDGGKVSVRNGIFRCTGRPVIFRV